MTGPQLQAQFDTEAAHLTASRLRRRIDRATLLLAVAAITAALGGMVLTAAGAVLAGAHP